MLLQVHRTIKEHKLIQFLTALGHDVEIAVTLSRHKRGEMSVTIHEGQVGMQITFYSQPRLRAMRAASTRFAAPSLLIASDK